MNSILSQILYWILYSGHYFSVSILCYFRLQLHYFSDKMLYFLLHCIYPTAIVYCYFAGICQIVSGFRNRAFVRAVRTSVRLWCHSYTVTAPSDGHSMNVVAKALAELMQKHCKQCLRETINQSRLDFLGRGLKETGVKTKCSDRRWIEVLQR